MSMNQRTQKLRNKGPERDVYGTTIVSDHWISVIRALRVMQMCKDSEHEVRMPTAQKWELASSDEGKDQVWGSEIQRARGTRQYNALSMDTLETSI